MNVTSTLGNVLTEFPKAPSDGHLGVLEPIVLYIKQSDTGKHSTFAKYFFLEITEEIFMVQDERTILKRVVPNEACRGVRVASQPSMKLPLYIISVVMEQTTGEFRTR